MNTRIKDLLFGAPDDIKRSFSERRYSAGQPILLEGDKNDTLYILTSGCAEVHRLSANGTLMRLYVNEEYSIFGELELFLDTETYGITAVTDCTAILIPKGALMRWMADDIAVSLCIIEEEARKMIADSEIISRLYFLTVDARVLDCIVGHEKDGTLPSLTKTALCSEAAAPLRSVNRSVAHWRQKGIVEYRNRRFTLLDAGGAEQELRRAYGGGAGADT